MDAFHRKVASGELADVLAQSLFSIPIYPRPDTEQTLPMLRHYLERKDAQRRQYPAVLGRRPVRLLGQFWDSALVTSRDIK